jgi:hypothetical protein
MRALSAVIIIAVLPMLLGCDSSLQIPDETDKLARLDGGEGANQKVYSDEADERRFPFKCAEDIECDDADPCTTDKCVKKRCRYTFKDVVLKSTIIKTAEPALDVSIHAANLFIATGSGGVALYDISTPRSPVAGNVAETQGEAIAVEAGEGGMLVSERETGLESFTAPALRQSWLREPDTGFLDGIDEVYNVDIGPRYGFVSGFIDGFLVLQAASMSDVSTVTGFETAGRVERVASTERLAVIADALGGAIVYGFDQPSGIEKTAKIMTDGRTLDVDVIGDTLLMAEYGKGFSLIDVSDMTAPKRLADIYTPSPVTAVRLLGAQTAVVGEKNGAVSVYDVSLNVTGEKKGDDDTVIPIAEPTAPRLLHSVKLKGELVRLDIERDLTAVALGETGAVLLRSGCTETEPAAEEGAK